MYRLVHWENGWEANTRDNETMTTTHDRIGCVQQSGVRVGPDRRYRRVVAESLKAIA